MTLVNSVEFANPSFFQKTQFNPGIDVASILEEVRYAFSRVINLIQIFIFNHFDLGLKERMGALEAATPIIDPMPLGASPAFHNAHSSPKPGKEGHDFNVLKKSGLS